MFQSMEVPLSMIVCIRWEENSLHISFYSLKVKISYHCTKYMYCIYKLDQMSRMLNAPEFAQ